MNRYIGIRGGLAGLAMLACLAFSGCLEERIFWSPDGNRAAVVTADGLYLSDGAGKLSPLLAPGAYRVAWFSDSERLMVARYREIKDYAALCQALGPERTRALTTKGEMVWQRLASSLPEEKELHLGSYDEIGAIALYLREFHADDFRKKFPDQKQTLDSASVRWHSLVTARVAGDRLEVLATVREGLGAIYDMRVAPKGTAAAVVTTVELSPTFDDISQLMVVAVDGSSPAVSVASNTGCYPDWTPDSRTLVYLQTASDHAGGDLNLGALVEREVLDADGRIKFAEKSRDLAGLIFHGRNRVRCLRDGRVIFDAGEFHLPMAGSKHDVIEQLFSIDRTQKNPVLTTLVQPDQRKKLPEDLTAFEISPDQTQVLFMDCGYDKTAFLTLATGAVEEIPLEISDGNHQQTPAPAWRRAGEFTYMKNEGKARDELILRQGARETVLSHDWPDDFVERLLAERK